MKICVEIIRESNLVRCDIILPKTIHGLSFLYQLLQVKELIEENKLLNKFDFEEDEECIKLIMIGETKTIASMLTSILSAIQGVIIMLLLHEEK